MLYVSCYRFFPQFTKNLWKKGERQYLSDKEEGEKKNPEQNSTGSKKKGKSQRSYGRHLIT